MPISLFNSWGYNSILSRGLDITGIESYIFSIYFPTTFILKIGLMETYQIFVEEHKGKISCLSGPEQGT